MSSSLLVQSSSDFNRKPDDYRFKTLALNPRVHVYFSRNKINLSCVDMSLRGLETSLRVQKVSKTKRNFVVYSQVEPLNPLPSGPLSGDAWKNWLLGIMISVIISSFTGDLGPLLLIKNKFDTKLQWVEDIVEATEKIARKIEKKLEDMIDKFPNGKLKNWLSKAEHIAEETADVAGKVDELIDEFQEKEKEFEDYIRSKEEKKAEESIDEKKAEESNDEKKKVEKSIDEKKADESIDEKRTEDQTR